MFSYACVFHICVSAGRFVPRLIVIVVRFVVIIERVALFGLAFPMGVFYYIGMSVTLYLRSGGKLTLYKRGQIRSVSIS